AGAGAGDPRPGGRASRDRLEHAGRRHAQALRARAERGRALPPAVPHGDDMGSWHGDADVAAYVEERLKRGVYRGIGEFHLDAAVVAEPVVESRGDRAADSALFRY